MKDRTVNEWARAVRESFAKYDRQGTRHWTWDTAARDLSYQVGELAKVTLQLSGERYNEGHDEAALRWQLRNELADIMAEVLYIASELGIDMNVALEEMVADDAKKIAERTKPKA